MRRLRRKLERWTGPSWPRPVRLGLALLMTAAGFICYRWRLTSAHRFGEMGLIVMAGLLLAKALWWRWHRASE